MLGHLGVNVPHLGTAEAYYGEIMPLLGYDLFLSSDEELAFLPADGRRGAYLFFYPAAQTGPYSRHRAGLQHLAFKVPTRSAVATVHARVVDLGSEVVHEPQEFPQYPPPYFATFWIDPFGFLLEAVCHHDRD